MLNAHSTITQPEEQPTRGSRQNLVLLEEGAIDIGQVGGNVARVSLEGIDRDPANLRVLAVMYPNPGTFVVRADLPCHSIADLTGQPIAFGTRAPGLRILVADILEVWDSTPKDFEPIILDQAGDGPLLVLEQKAAVLRGAGIGWPGFVKAGDSHIADRTTRSTPSDSGRGFWSVRIGRRKPSTNCPRPASE